MKQPTYPDGWDAERVRRVLEHYEGSYPLPGRGSREIDSEASRNYIPDMRAVGLKVLKNKLSEYVRLAQGGETILVTDRDRVVAELTPPAWVAARRYRTPCSPR